MMMMMMNDTSEQSHNNKQSAAVTRPTEAQLRWAQFHHKKGAVAVREKVQELWQTPSSISDVSGAVTDDGNTSPEETDSIIIRSDGNENAHHNGAQINSSLKTKQQSRVLPKRNKPKISRGRRALLRVSKRKLEQRRREIAQNGFKCYGECLQDESVESDDDGLAAIFAEDTYRKKRKRRQSRKRRPADEEERVRRFEAAFHAMLTSLAATTANNTPEVTVPTKKWTRPIGVQSTFLADSSLQPHAALWNPTLYRGGDTRHFTEAMRQQLTNVARHYIVEDEDDNHNDQTPSPRRKMTEKEVAGFVEYFEKHMTSGEKTTPKTPVLMSPKDISSFVEQFERGMQRETDGEENERRRSTLDIVERFESPGIERKEKQMGFVKRFVAQMEQAAKEETLVSADGKLHKPTFARLLHRYLGQTRRKRKSDVFLRSAPSPLAMARSKHDYDDLLAVEDDSDLPLIQLLIDKMEGASDVDSLLTSEGNLNVMALEDFVTRYLEEAEFELDDSNDCVQTPIKVNDEESSQRLPRFLEKFRSTGKSVANESRTDTPGMSARKLAGTVSNRIGGIFHNLGGNSSDEGSGLKAYSAFRSRRSSQSNDPGDETSSASSFRVLPDGIRNVVKNFRGFQQALSPSFEEDGGNSEHKQESESASHIYSNYETASYSGKSRFSEISPERVKDLQSALMEGGRRDQSNIIDTDGSEASAAALDPDLVASLLLSPTILTKRHQQAIRAIEDRKWDQVSYLLSANPWLAEMTDVNTNAYLLHKLAFYGSGQLEMDPETGEAISFRYPPAPDDINIDLIRMFSASVHKFDQDGCLPLHWAASSANLSMLELLGSRFPEGASVRNHNGMLPLHLVILACAAPLAATYQDDVSARDIVKIVIDYFPGAIAIPDNEGNLPIHLAASVLRGDVGVEIIYCLLDAAERQISDPYGVRFNHNTKLKVEDDESIQTETTESPTDSSLNDLDVSTNCLLARNERGHTPLIGAIQSRSGWEVIEALTCGPWGAEAAESEKNKALHLLVNEPYKDPASALSLLKVCPEAAAISNEQGILPIEFACMQMFPREVILAFVLTDLPVNLDEKNAGEVKEGYGASWWYINCDCDDFYVDVVEDVIGLCSFPQIRALCLTKDEYDESLLSRATPKCREALKRALRFVGRFEFVGSAPIETDTAIGLKVFDALDFGTPIQPIVDGKRVLLKCFSREEAFAQECEILSFNEMDFSFIEEILTFTVGGDFWAPAAADNVQKHFISIERPNLTLGGVLKGMLDNEDCQTDPEIRSRYAVKVFSVLRTIAKALRYLHSVNIVHGDISLENCGKFGDKWKLANYLGSQVIGQPFQPSRLSASAPPESIYMESDSGGTPAFRHDMVASPAIDSWAFGKLAFEVLAGEPLFESDGVSSFENDIRGMLHIRGWSDDDLHHVTDTLMSVGVPVSGVELIAECLSPDADMRPVMDDILHHPVWKELRRQSGR